MCRGVKRIVLFAAYVLSVCLAFMGCQAGNISASVSDRSAVCIIGASIACPENTWFEMSCEQLGVQSINKAQGWGTRPSHDVVSMAEGTLFASGEQDSFEVLAIMHCHNVDVLDETKLLPDYRSYELSTTMDYTQAYDYIIRSYIDACRALEFDDMSKWYGVAGGKPVRIVLCTYWHDARERFNESIRRLRNKWGDYATLCAFDEHIGFTKDVPNPVTGEQESLQYAQNGFGDTEEIDGVVYGWHPTRGRGSEIQQRMARIFADVVAPLVQE